MRFGEGKMALEMTIHDDERGRHVRGRHVRGRRLVPEDQ
jgi:hypothetical protein